VIRRAGLLALLAALLAAGPAAAQEAAPVSLAAAFGGEGKAIRSGLAWRVYADRLDGSPMTLVARSQDAAPRFALAPGTYVVNATYGFASASKKITVGPEPLSDRLSIAAGALKLGGAIGDVPIPPSRLSFSVFVPVGRNSEGRLVRGGVKAEDVVRLPEGTYHVVSTYGDSNAIMRADLKVESGRLTEATLNHRAATVTLKLVAAPGAEAFAGTAFSVLTPGGDTIREAIGAFPSVALAEGDYVLIARHDGDVFTRDFKVTSGRDQDIEVVAKAK
jgi:hypothetical protein